MESLNAKSIERSIKRSTTSNIVSSTLRQSKGNNPAKNIETSTSVKLPLQVKDFCHAYLSLD